MRTDYQYGVLILLRLDFQIAGTLIVTDFTNAFALEAVHHLAVMNEGSVCINRVSSLRGNGINQ
jgi:hypothetical protein